MQVESVDRVVPLQLYVPDPDSVYVVAHATVQVAPSSMDAPGAQGVPVLPPTKWLAVVNVAVAGTVQAAAKGWTRSSMHH